MFKNILVAVDPSFDARQDTALQMAGKLASDTLAEISALTVVEPMPLHIPADYGPDISVQAGEKAMQALRDHIGEGTEIRTFVRHGRAAHEIIEHAKEHGCDCIIVASHRPDLSDYLLGSTAARVVRHAPCSVVVLR